MPGAGEGVGVGAGVGVGVGEGEGVGVGEGGETGLTDTKQFAVWLLLETVTVFAPDVP